MTEIQSSVNLWADNNKVQVKEGKLEQIHFRKRSRLRQPYYLTVGEHLISNNIKDVGVNFDKNLSWNAHTGNKVNIVCRMSILMLRTYNTRIQCVIILISSSFLRTLLE